jgi:putative spermidine/putrescine transport system substrate-binding protein
MTLGDAWLGDAIRQNLIQPWTLEGLEGWDTLHDRYRSLVTRNAQGLPDLSGQIGGELGGQVWGLPYRWGTTAIAYRPSVFKKWGWEPQNWSDLWRSDLQGQIGLPDDPREVIGLTLKSLGASYNTPDPDTVPDLSDRLWSLHRQVKFYSSTHLVQPLLVKDVALIVGWSTDLLPLTNLDRDLRMMLPQSGTALWADLWVRPSQAAQENLEAAKNWVNFCWQRDRVDLFSRFGQGTSPLAGVASQAQDSHRAILNPPPEWLDRCEFVLPLSPNSQTAYQRLWQTMRESSV